MGNQNLTSCCCVQFPDSTKASWDDLHSPRNIPSGIRSDPPSPKPLNKRVTRRSHESEFAETKQKDKMATEK